MDIPRNTIAKIWNLSDNHVPSVHGDWWEELIPTNFRAIAASVDHPVPITERRSFPQTLYFRPPLQTLLLCGEALLHAVFDPCLRISLVGKRLLYASGVTILVIEQGLNGEVLAVPWSLGESRKTVKQRMIRMRKQPPPSLNAQESYVARNLLPRCQGAVSVVGHLGIHNPGTNIMASGGECPIAIVLGKDSIHFALDHRVYDPYPHASTLYERFFDYLDIAGKV